MNKICNKNNWSAWVLCVISIVTTAMLIKYLPKQIPVHFDFRGNADNYASKYYLFTFPVLIAIFNLISAWLSDKLVSSENNRKYYYRIVFFANLFVFTFELVTIAIAKQAEMGLYNNLLLVLVGVIIIIIGNMLPKFKYNFLFGIRNKWTIEDEHVWYSTHRFSGKLWFLCGILLVLAVFTRGIVHVFIVTGITVLLVAGPVLYSRIIYNKQNKRSE